MPTSWKIAGVLGILAIIVCYCLYGMSTANAGMRPCPACGKETSSALVAEQGCCNDCYDRVERSNRYYTSNNNGSKKRDTDQYDFYYREDQEQQRRDDEYERMHENGY